VQRVSLGATTSGELVAIEHEATSAAAAEDLVVEPSTIGTHESYRCPNLATRDRMIRLDIPTPGWMRAPGHAEGSFALESAIDELSYAVGLDPLELRIRNHADVNPDNGLPWSSNYLLECYRRGAERFGWARRGATPGSMRQGRLLVGYGMAAVNRTLYQQPCSARASLRSDGSAYVCSAGTDIGPGTYTVMTQIAADVLGLAAERVTCGLGDTDLPRSPQQGGSGLAAAMGNAVHASCTQLLRALVELEGSDAQSQLRGCTMTDVIARDGGLAIRTDPARFERYTDILARHGRDRVTADGDSTPPTSDRWSAAGGQAAHFVELHVDPDLGKIRVARVVSAVDSGRILNEKTARSQVVGAIIGGIGMALLEETIIDEHGRVINASLGEYLVPVNADIGDIEVLFVGQPDPSTPVGSKGLGELCLIGIAAAIANAVYHATGVRLRSTPLRYRGRAALTDLRAGRSCDPSVV
jgi:CO/xanthine dehydrogenase Mo-binding subunit